MGATEVQQLSQGRWPLLEALNVSCSDLDHSVIVHLVQGNWPLLKKLTLHRVCMTEAVCELLQIIIVSEQLLAMHSAMIQPDLFGSFCLERLSSTVWPHLQNILVLSG